MHEQWGGMKDIVLCDLSKPFGISLASAVSHLKLLLVSSVIWFLSCDFLGFIPEIKMVLHSISVTEQHCTTMWLS